MKRIVLCKEYEFSRFGYKTEEGIEESKFLSIAENGELIYTDPASLESFEKGPASENLYEMNENKEWELADVETILGECEFVEEEE